MFLETYPTGHAMDHLLDKSALRSFGFAQGMVCTVNHILDVVVVVVVVVAAVVAVVAAAVVGVSLSPSAAPQTHSGSCK